MGTPLQAIYDEHRSIAAVLDGMRSLVRAKRERDTRINPRVFGAMLYYLDVFAERVHHPREEAHLFARLRMRTRAADAVLDELDREHAAGEEAMRSLQQAFVRYEEGGDAEFSAFAAKVERFADIYCEHMRKEEELLMPCARRVFTAEDWAEVEEAFAAEADPLVGAVAHVGSVDYQALLSRIVNLAPPPIGVGPAT